MKIRISLIILLSIILSFNIHAQSKKQKLANPEVGQYMPNLILHNIEYYSAKQAAIKDFRGKWLILDFWNKNCGSCVVSFPRTSEMQKEFAGNVQFMLVANEDPENQIRTMYAKYRKKQNLLMPCAFDSTLHTSLKITAVPRLYIIDPEGILRGITTSIHSDQIRDFLSGKTPELTKTGEERLLGMYKYDDSKPLLINGNGGADTDFLFRSVLSAFNSKIHQQAIDNNITEYDAKRGMFQETGLSLILLYNFAYFGRMDPSGNVDENTYGKYFNDPILEISDSSKFKASITTTGTTKNVYSYSLIIPPAKETLNGQQAVERIQKNMQRDLENYFGFEAAVETRKCLCWTLVATPEARIKLKTKGGPESSQGGAAELIAKNFSLKHLLGGIIRYHQDKINLIIDDTGIDSNIDITMDCMFTNLDDVKKALRANGLDLIQREKEMKVLVIKDKDSSQLN